MSFLQLNNWTVPAKLGSPKLSIKDAGRGRRLNGTYVNQRVWVAREWSFQTPMLLTSVAEALEGMLRGRGHVWPFDYDIYSSRGRPPTAGYTASGTVGSGTVKFANPVNSFMALGGTGGTITFTAPADFGAANGTISFWMWLADGTYNQWRHYLRRNDNSVSTTRVDNGAGPANPLNYAATFGASVHSLTVTAKNAANLLNTSCWIEDLVIVPYAMPDALVTALYTSTAAFGMAPILRMTGDVLDEPGPLYVQAEVTGVEYGQGQPGASWQNNLRSISFTLREVDPRPDVVTP